MTVVNYMSVMISLFVFHLQEPGYVGFANLPNQVHRKSVKKGFEFTLMVVGKCMYFNLVSCTITFGA